MDLLLARGQVIRVQISFLDGGEEQLTGRGIVAMRPSINHLNAKPAEMILDFTAGVIAGAIQQ